MTIKEKFLAIETYEEFDRRRAEFRDLKLADADDDIWEHIYFIKKEK